MIPRARHWLPSCDTGAGCVLTNQTSIAKQLFYGAPKNIGTNAKVLFVVARKPHLAFRRLFRNGFVGGFCALGQRSLSERKRSPPLARAEPTVKRGRGTRASAGRRPFETVTAIGRSGAIRRSPTATCHDPCGGTASCSVIWHNLSVAMRTWPRTNRVESSSTLGKCSSAWMSRRRTSRNASKS
jgi:hypothetical protein